MGSALHFQRIYVESALRSHPRTVSILRRFPRAEVIECDRYGEIFNRNAQDFRLQKQRPALILAEKFHNFVLEAPPGYGIGGSRNFYFSHMLNCIYDCRYCFLQGMFRSAHFVFFLNYEGFETAIVERIGESEETSYFFSGYDCDSLALEAVTGFAAHFIDLFRRHPRGILELRTKSAQVSALIATEPIQNCVVAFSFTPDEVSRILEHGVPSVERRIEALVRLQESGWKIGLRFDPLLYFEDYAESYRRLFTSIFRRLDVAGIHSVSYGSFRLPKTYYDRVSRLYPDEKLFAGPMENQAGLIGYRRQLEEEMLRFCATELADHVPADLVFPCVF